MPGLPGTPGGHRVIRDPLPAGERETERATTTATALAGEKVMQKKGAGITYWQASTYF